jgi:hypothetical protein
MKELIEKNVSKINEAMGIILMCGKETREIQTVNPRAFNKASQSGLLISFIYLKYLRCYYKTVGSY